MEKLDARKRYTQMVLKQSFLKLLKEKPVNRITVKEVCALAQLNRATFYAHYSDCFALMESIENELIDAFEKSLRYVNSFDVTALIEAIYDMVDRNQAACRVLILGNTSSTVLMRMIALAKKDSIAYWRKELPNASETELEMMYTHLSNGLMHVVVEGYTIVGVAAEHGSGMTLDRPALQEVMEAVLAGKVDVVLISSLDRIGRDWGMTKQYIALLTEHKVKLLCLRERVSSDISGVSPFST